MADLSFSQGADPVAVFNDSSGNQLVINFDGSLNADNTISYRVGQDRVFTLSGSFNAASGGSDNPIFLIKNPSGSGKVIRLRRLYVGCSVTNVLVTYSIYYAPTITSNGTTQTPRNNLIGSGTASATQCFSLPTLSSNGTLIFTTTIGQNSAPSEINPAINIQANNNIVITAAPGSNNRAVQITAIWVEE